MTLSLADLGWSDHFDAQCDAATDGPARITALHRTRIEAMTPAGPTDLLPHLPASDFAVGDWVLSAEGKTTARLTPKTEIARRAAGHEATRQLIATNVDTLAIVSGATHDFNIARIERYLALALTADTLPLIVLTRADEADDTRALIRQVERLSPLVTALALDARDRSEALTLAPWCKDGQTMAFVGSSGVGKTTLRNHLTGDNAATQGLREDDAKGRHTTTSRAMLRTSAGGWIIDTPGMRELQMLDAGDGIDALFEDITDLATRCKFRDCAHDGEPGCAVAAAIEDGTLEADRLARWRKLLAEDAHNSRDVAEQRAHYRGLQRMYNAGKARSRSKRGID